MLESIKKVDKKLIAMMGIIVGVILIIVIVVIVVSLTTGGKLSFEKIENKLVKATENYCEDNDDKLPKEIGEEVIVEGSTLVSGGYIKDLSEYTDEGVSCSAEVIVGKNENGYDYVASLDCGEKYKTTFLADKLKENVVTSGTGLYKVEKPTVDLGVDADGYDLSSNELMSGYTFRGEKPNNYIKLDDKKYKIVKVDENGDIMVVVISNKNEKGVYDDRYNEETDAGSGKNDYTKSRAYENITDIYNKLGQESIIKQKAAAKNICVGPRSADDTSKDGSAECSVVMKNQYYSLLPVYDVLNASLEPLCVKTTDASCENYNYLATGSSYWTMTPNAKNSYTAYGVSGSVLSNKLGKSYTYKYAFYLSGRLVYVSGTGTSSDPYIVK